MKYNGKIKLKQEDVNMAVLATPKKNSYVLKKDSAEKIVKSKNSVSDITLIEEKAAQFKKNNIKKK